MADDQIELAHAHGRSYSHTELLEHLSTFSNEELLAELRSRMGGRRGVPCPSWCQVSAEKHHEEVQAEDHWYVHQRQIVGSGTHDLEPVAEISLSWIQEPHELDPATSESKPVVLAAIHDADGFTPARARELGEALIQAANLLEAG